MANLDRIKKKKGFFLSIGLYLIGFIILISIEEKINQDNYILTALLSPLIILVSFILMIYFLFNN